ncbi:hypothetical protein AAC387_Pa10g2127 [Persea americana]
MGLWGRGRNWLGVEGTKSSNNKRRWVCRVEGETRGEGGGRMVALDWWRWIWRRIAPSQTNFWACVPISISLATVGRTLEELKGEERRIETSLAWKRLVPQKINRDPISET